MTAVIRAKTWEQRRDEKITAEYVRLSEENRELRHELQSLRKDYIAAVEQIQELQQTKAKPSEQFIDPRLVC